jgi:uncharacterized protein YggE
MNKISRGGVAVVVLSLWMTGVGALANAQSQRTQQPSIRVTGEAAVMANPDQAKIDIGVVTQAERADAAALRNAERTEAVLAALHKTLGQGAEIKTISYSINPNYRYPQEGGTPTITAYTATNTLQVTVNDLKSVGKVIDVAVQFGANAIQRLQFTLKDESAVQAQALREAAAKARDKAQTIASALGVKIVQILEADESVSAGIPRVFGVTEARAGAAAAPTPVEPGSITVRATVTLTVGIGQ